MKLGWFVSPRAIVVKEGQEVSRYVPTADVGSRVDQANDVGIVIGVATDAKNVGEGQVRTIAALLIPTLDGGTDGAGDNGQIEETRDAPLVLNLLDQDVPLRLAEGLFAADALEGGGILCDQGALTQEERVLLHLVLTRELVDIGEQGMAGDACQGITNPVAGGQFAAVLKHARWAHVLGRLSYLASILSLMSLSGTRSEG